MPRRNPHHPMEPRAPRESQPERARGSTGVDYLDDPHDVMKRAIAKFSYLNIPMALITDYLGMGKNQITRWRTGAVIPKSYQAFLFKALAAQVSRRAREAGVSGPQALEQIARERIS